MERPSTSTTTTTQQLSPAVQSENVSRHNRIVNNHSTTTTTSSNSGSNNNNNSGGGRSRRTRTEQEPLASSVQELVRLDNPRPRILRHHNEYVTVEPGSHADGSTKDGGKCEPNARTSANASATAPTLPPRLRLSSPSDFDRVKVHQQHASTSKQFADIKPLVKDGHHGTTQQPQAQLERMSSSMPTPNRQLQTNNNNSGGKRVRRQHSHDANAFARVQHRHNTNNNSNNNNNNNNANMHSTNHNRNRNSNGNLFEVSLERPKSMSPSVQLPTRRSSTTCMNHHNVVGQSGASLTSASAVSGELRCTRCGRCTCEACSTPRQLPSCWLCDNQLHCSVGNCVDCVSCMCCVRACLYHTIGDDDDGPTLMMDDDRQLFACNRHTPDFDHDLRPPGRDVEHDRESTHCHERYACLTLAHVLLPCIWCYWPLRLAARACNSIYSYYHQRGCVCPQRNGRQHRSTRGGGSMHTNDSIVRAQPQSIMINPDALNPSKL